MSYPNQPPSRPRYDPNAVTRANQLNPAPPAPPAPQIPPPGPKGYPPLPTQQPPQTQSQVQVQYQSLREQRRKQRRKQNFQLGCGLALGLAVIISLCLASAYVAAMFVAPVNGNILVIGIDRVPEGTTAGRTDTNILVRVNPSKPSLTTLSVPRDLWVKIPGYGDNRINTAHFYAEAAEPGTGPANARLAFEQNFGIQVPNYVRIRLEGVPGLIDAMGGVTIDLPKEMGGLSPGKHHLDGTQALAFIRDRKGTDDFFRMADGQFFIKSAAQEMLNPLTWPRLPLIYAAFQKTVDTNLSIWQLANIGVTIVRVGPANINSNVLPREDTTPTVINGAQVLLPRWDLIHPLVDQLFK